MDLGASAGMIEAMRLAWTFCLLLSACTASLDTAPAGGGGGPIEAVPGAFASPAVAPPAPGGAVGVAGAAACPADLLTALADLVAQVRDPAAHELLAFRQRELSGPGLQSAGLVARQLAVSHLTGTVDDLAREGRLDPVLAARFRDLAGCLQLAFNRS